MKVEFWISDFHFEIEVQMIMDLMDRKMKIWLRISSGKEPHHFVRVQSTVPGLSKFFFGLSCCLPLLRIQRERER